MNGTCEGINFTHLTELMLLHYLVKVEKPKMHVNTTSAVNVNYKIAVTCIKLYIDSFIKCSTCMQNANS